MYLLSNTYLYLLFSSLLSSSLPLSLPLIKLIYERKRPYIRPDESPCSPPEVVRLEPLPRSIFRILSMILTSTHLTSTHLTSPHLTSPHLTSPHLTSPHLTSPHLTSPHLTSPHLTSPHLTSPHLTSHHLNSLLQGGSNRPRGEAWRSLGGHQGRHHRQSRELLEAAKEKAKEATTIGSEKADETLNKARAKAGR